MPDQSIEALRQKAQREVGDKLLQLLWVATAIQGTLIVIQAARMLGFILPFGNPDIHATDISSTGYLIVQLAYMGKKEFIRWTRGVAGSFRLDAPGILDVEETYRRVRRGDVAVMLWGALFFLCIVLNVLHLIPDMPLELTRTFVQVAALYTFATVSKAKKEALSKSPQPQAVSQSPSSTAFRLKVQPKVSGSNSSQLKTEQVLELAKRKGQVSLKQVMDELGLPRSTASRNLSELVNIGALERTGQTRKTVYMLVAGKKGGNGK